MSLLLGRQEELPTRSHCDKCLGNTPGVLGTWRHVPSSRGLLGKCPADPPHTHTHTKVHTSTHTAGMSGPQGSLRARPGWLSALMGRALPLVSEIWNRSWRLPDRALAGRGLQSFPGGSDSRNGNLPLLSPRMTH